MKKKVRKSIDRSKKGCIFAAQNQLKSIKMKTQTLLKVVGYFKDCNLGVKLNAGIYYLNKEQRENGVFDVMRDRVLQKHHQFFDIVDSNFVDMPYQPKNIIINLAK